MGMIVMILLYREKQVNQIFFEQTWVVIIIFFGRGGGGGGGGKNKLEFVDKKMNSSTWICNLVWWWVRVDFMF